MEYVQMTIHVTFYGQARRLSGKSSEKVELSAGGTVMDVVKTIAIGPLQDLFLDATGEVRTTIMISVNGVHVREYSTALADGDEVDVHTPLAGG
jgi:molybdopterin converting factor small subunit